MTTAIRDTCRRFPITAVYLAAMSLLLLVLAVIS